MARDAPGLINRHPVGSGDLVRLLEIEGLGSDLAAKLTGFVEVEQDQTGFKLQDSDDVQPTSEVETRRSAEVTRRPTPGSAEIWRVDHEERYPEALAGANEPELPEALLEVEPLTDDKLRATTLLRPRVPPLAPWRRLAPALRAMLSWPVQRSRLDERRLVERCARLRPVLRIPRRTRRQWVHRIRVLWDRAELLAGFVDDQRSVLRWLRRWRGPIGLEIVTVDAIGTQRRVPIGRRASGDGDSAREGREPGSPRLLPAGATVLALSDLGCLGQDEARRASWVAIGRELWAAGARPVALALAPRRRLTGPVARAWRMVPWERVRPHGRGSGGPFGSGDNEAELVGEVLDLLSVAVRIDTAVLRSVRRLVSGADLGVESEVRLHPDVVHRSEHGIVLDPEKLGERRQRFRAIPSPRRRQVAAVLRRCHQDLAPCLLHEELLLAGDPAEQEAALAFFARLARRVNAYGPHEAQHLIDIYISLWTRRRQPTCWEREVLAWLWALAYRSADGLSFDEPLPDGLELQQISWALRRRDAVRWWRVVQRGDILELQPVESPEPSLPAGAGFLVGHLPSRGDHAWIRPEVGVGRALELSSSPQVIELPRCGRLMLETDCGRLSLRSMPRPSWAQAIVRWPPSTTSWLEVAELGNVPWPTWARQLTKDRFGVVAELELAPGAVMRFRWVPPGTFVMGSPEDERGRFSDEGPQREVQLTRGFWLAETPCTQQQWEAVMRANPSAHPGAQHPVENVSWEDCQQYVSLLNERFPGLRMRLPTEAEWEYACRAGTTSAFNDGSACTKPSGKDPALERLGWYKENSGETTHSVAQKAANAWGLYDMHGNVWEWCGDWWNESYAKAGTVNPTGPADGRLRVIRGGCAWDTVWRCRSAYRDRRPPAVRYPDLGFRPAAGQAEIKEPPEGAGRKRSQEGPNSGGAEGGTTESRRARRWPFLRWRKEKR